MSETTVRWSLLGPVRGWVGATELVLGPPQQRAVLAIMLARAGRPVSMGEIIDMLWPGEAPDSAPNVVHRYVGALRRLIEPGLPKRAVGRWLVPIAGGYRVVVDSASLDLLRFRELVRDSESTVGARAVELLVEALGLWGGAVAAGVPDEVRTGVDFVAIEQERLLVARRAGRLATALGEPEAVLPALREIAARHPLDEALHAELMLALAASGAQAEAIAVHTAIRARLDTELGVTPGEALRAAHGIVLGEVAPAPARPVVRPAQLPRGLAAIVGRDAEIRAVTGPSAAGLFAITGMAGVGKTTFAVHAARAALDRYPDGQLYADLHGVDPDRRAVEPETQLGEFLHALGVSSADLPAGERARVALYRSLLDGRRMVVLLDNARDVEQVRDLLPGPDCLTIVTSRGDLSGLVAADGAHPLRLGVLDDNGAHGLLADRIGADRVAREPAAADDIVRACGHLPLALAVVAARAATNPDFPLAALATELAESRDRLDVLSTADASFDVRAVFSWSYHGLSRQAAALFRLLALAPGDDIAVGAVAALLGQSPTTARGLVAELARAQLATEHRPGRYTCHDLLAAYAEELTSAEDPRPVRDRATARLLAYYLHSARACALIISPSRPPIPVPPPPAGVHPVEPADRDQAVAWFERERSVLIAAQATAVATGDDATAWRLGWALGHFLDGAGHWHDMAATSRIAADAARRAGDRIGEGHGLLLLARAEADLGQHATAVAHGEHALRLFDGVAEGRLLADAYRSNSWLCESMGAYLPALRHAEEALRLTRDGGDDAGTARAVNAVGWYLSLLGRYDEALEQLQEGLACLEKTDDDYGRADLHDSIGHTLFHLGRPDEACEHYRLAVEGFRALGIRFAMADTLDRLGDAEQAAGRRAAAETCWSEAVSVLDGLGLPRADDVRAKLGAPPASGVH